MHQVWLIQLILFALKNLATHISFQDDLQIVRYSPNTIATDRKHLSVNAELADRGFFLPSVHARNEAISCSTSYFLGSPRGRPRNDNNKFVTSCLCRTRC